MTFFAQWRNVGEAPTDVVSAICPSGVTSQASTTAQSNWPRNPQRTCCARCERCMSKKRVLPALMLSRSDLLLWYGVRQEMASARASSPSRESPVEAPVTTATLKGRPAVCSARARAASALGVTFAAPAAVKPLKPIVWP